MSIGWGCKLICQDFFPPTQLWLHLWFFSDSPKFFVGSDPDPAVPKNETLKAPDLFTPQP